MHFVTQFRPQDALRTTAASDIRHIELRFGKTTCLRHTQDTVAKGFKANNRNITLARVCVILRKPLIAFMSPPDGLSFLTHYRIGFHWLSRRVHVRRHVAKIIVQKIFYREAVGNQKRKEILVRALALIVLDDDVTDARIIEKAWRENLRIEQGQQNIVNKLRLLAKVLAQI